MKLEFGLWAWIWIFHEVLRKKLEKIWRLTPLKCHKIDLIVIQQKLQDERSAVSSHFLFCMRWQQESLDFLVDVKFSFLLLYAREWDDAALQKQQSNNKNFIWSKRDIWKYLSKQPRKNPGLFTTQFCTLGISLSLVHLLSLSIYQEINLNFISHWSSNFPSFTFLVFLSLHNTSVSQHQHHHHHHEEKKSSRWVI